MGEPVDVLVQAARAKLGPLGRPRDEISESDVAIDGLLGRHETECRYIATSCHWCGGLGLNPMVSNRIRVMYDESLLWIDDVKGYRLFLRIAAMEMYQTGAFAGAVLCQYAELLGHCTDLERLPNWRLDSGLMPKPEWACERCEGHGGWGEKATIG